MITLGAVVLSGLMAAQEPSPEPDWSVTTRYEQVMAALSYGDNVIVLRCEADALDLIVTGVPEIGANVRQVRVSIGPVADERQSWTTVPDGPIISAAEPGRMARALRAGGEFSLRLEPVEASEGVEAQPARRYIFPIPASTHSVDNVLEACEEPLTDDRDRVERMQGLTVTWRDRPMPQYPGNPAAMAARAGEVKLNCIVGADERPKDCRVVRSYPAGRGFEESAVRAAHRSRLDLTNAEDTVGKAFLFSIRFRIAS